MYWQLLVFVFSFFVGSLGSNFEMCPPGWSSYSSSATTTCLWLSVDYVSAMSSAHASCVKKNASIVIIDTKEKFDKIKLDYSSYILWIGLQRVNHKQKWLTKDGLIPAENLPFHVSWRSSFDDNGAIIEDGDIKLRNNMYRSSRYRYLCERRAGCKKGWYGLGCDHECHCYEQECDQTSLQIECSFGCKVGWMGDDCSQKKEDAKVRYFCVNSEDQGKYAHVIVETNGVYYHNINPVNDKGDWVSWCNNTFIYDLGNNSSTTHIKLFIDNNTNEDIIAGQCAGKITDTGSYEWKIKIQEHDGLVSRNDQEIEVACDFSDGDKFILSGETEIKDESTKRPVKHLEEDKEIVKLELVDPSKLEPVSEIIIGSPVAIRITFGLGEDNVATGVRPYNCKASSPDGVSKAQFLDKDGCSVNGFPISEFHKSGPKTLMTHHFQLFGFENTKEVEFHCLYSLCFENEDCQMGCAANDEHPARFRRSTNGESLSSKSTIKILRL